MASQGTAFRNVLLVRAARMQLLELIAGQRGDKNTDDLFTTQMTSLLHRLPVCASDRRGGSLF